MFPGAVRITFTWMPGELDPALTSPVIMQLVMEEPALAKCCLGVKPLPHYSPTSGHHYFRFVEQKTEAQRMPEVTQQPRGRDRTRTASTGPFSSGPCHSLDKDTAKSLIHHNLD